MRKIKTTIITEQHGMTALPVDWGKTVLFKNKDKAKRTAVKLNKHYQQQLQHLNFMLLDAFSIYRRYWLFLSSYDNEQMRQRFDYVMTELDHAIEYQDLQYNTPADINRVIADLNSICDSLLLHANKRKDIPLVHEIKHLKTRIADDYSRQPAGVKGSNKCKRPALRQANG